MNKLHMYYLLIANIDLGMKLKTSNQSKYELERIICSYFPRIMDFTSKKKKSDTHLLLLPMVTMDVTSEKRKSDAYLLLLPLVTIFLRGKTKII